MNKARRKRIGSVIHTLENIIDYDLIESVKDEKKKMHMIICLRIFSIL